MKNITKKFIHTDKRRFYQLYLSQDLFGDLVLTKAWGSMENARGRVVHSYFQELSCALKKFEFLVAYRLQRGYQLTTWNEPT